MEAEKLRLVGLEQQVPLVTGGTTRYVNLDYAASAPALVAVAEAVEALGTWYSSVHRGAGFKSRVATAAYEGAREAVRSFFGARADDAVIFTRNTTDSINLFAAALPDEVEVIGFAGEHHANLLPWQRRTFACLPVAASPDELLERLEGALRQGSGPRLVAITGASNVTGEIVPLDRVAELAHRHGARLLVDAAQLAPHRPIDMAASGIDYLAMSGHKLYAPYGAGVLIGRGDWLGGGPFLRGGGAVKLVTVDDVVWAELPDRQEAGSPNVLGAVALGAACAALAAYGMDRVAADEEALTAFARTRLARVPGFEHYTLWGAAAPRVGLFTFNLAGYEHERLAAILSAEHGIGVRHGCFCAHPLMIELLRIERAEADGLIEATRRGEHPRLPGAARISFGLGSTRDDVERVACALEAIAADGPHWRYRLDPLTDEWEPDPDPRQFPDLPFALAHLESAGEAS
jgi:selenocysteine lyase/cysteine desulfurase